MEVTVVNLVGSGMKVILLGMCIQDLQDVKLNQV